MNIKKLGTSAVAVIAMLAAGLSLGFAHASTQPVPDCGEKITYYSSSSMTTEIGYHLKTPLKKPYPCGCTEIISGDTSSWYTIEDQPWCV